MRGRGRAGVWQGRTAQNSGRIFALDGAWGAKVGLDPPKTDAIFFLLGKIEIDERTVYSEDVVVSKAHAAHGFPTATVVERVMILQLFMLPGTFHSPRQ